MSLTVPEAARRTGRNPETIRRWIREGKLRAHKVGTQHLIEEPDLAAMTDTAAEGGFAVPAAWRSTWTGERMPDWVTLVRRSRTRG
jgi:excisionase family DNA binding protein